MSDASVIVRGIGLVGAFGLGTTTLRRVLRGESPLPTAVEVALPIGSQPRSIRALRAETAPLETLVSARVLRRMDRYSRLALLASYDALADAGLSGASGDGLGVVVASGYGATGVSFAFLNSFVGHGDACASPTHFVNSLHNVAAANLSVILGATGPNLSVSQLDQSVPSALLTAYHWVREGRAEHVLFGAIDEMSDLMGYVWSRWQPTTPAAMTPLVTRASSAIPSEGVAFFVLSRGDARDGYCSIDRIDLGAAGSGPRLSREATALVIAADGRPGTGEHYRAAAAGARVACYSPVYGCLPAGPAFDLAIAALSLKDGLLSASPAASGCDLEASVADACPLLAGSTLDCLSLTSNGDYGLISLSRSR
jgi:3-oxoacyl-[acyl-carrier-protein] synthase II